MQQAGASRRGRGFARRSSWLAPRLRQAPLAGLVGAARALRLLRPIRVGTLSTVEPEKAAVRARRAPIAAQGRPPDLMRLPHDARRPPRGAHAIRAAQLSLARLIQECAPRGRELLSPRGPWGSAGWTPPGTWSRALKTGGTHAPVSVVILGVGLARHGVSVCPSIFHASMATSSARSSGGAADARAPSARVAMRQRRRATMVQVS